MKSINLLAKIALSLVFSTVSLSASQTALAYDVCYYMGYEIDCPEAEIENDMLGETIYTGYEDYDYPYDGGMDYGYGEVIEYSDFDENDYSDYNGFYEVDDYGYYYGF